VLCVFLRTRLIRPRLSLPCLQRHFLVRNESGTAKIVVRMQHPPTTFLETARTPKKAADA
jgi:hypothetical protein